MKITFLYNEMISINVTIQPIHAKLNSDVLILTDFDNKFC